MAFHNEFKTNEAKLAQTLLTYEKLCAKDPALFMNKFPECEKWRFFIDGNQQNEKDTIDTINGFKEIDLSLQEKKIAFSFLGSQISALIDPDTYQQLPEECKIICHKMTATIDEQEGENLTLHEILLRARGWLPFEKKEPNYLKALLKALRSLTDFTNKKIARDYILTLHNAATSGVNGLKFQKIWNKNKSGEFRVSQKGHLSLNLKNSSVAGLKKILDQIEVGDEKHPEFRLYLEVENKDLDSDEEVPPFDIAKVNIVQLREMELECKNNQDLASYLHKTIKENKIALKLYSEIKSGQVQELIKAIVDDYIKTYEYELKEAGKASVRQLECIAKFIQNLEQLQPFGDANCRTFCMLLLNRLLMENGFPPVILPNPHRFEAYSVEELIEEIIIGMDNTLLVAQGKKDLYGVTTQEILDLATEEELLYAEALGLVPAPIAITSITVTQVGLFSNASLPVTQEAKLPTRSLTPGRASAENG